MAKVSRRKLNPIDHEHYVGNLYMALSALRTKDEVQELMRDLFTHTELTMLAKRLEVARRLLKEQTYEAIIGEMAVTDRTIANMSNILATQGKGLRLADEKLSAQEAEAFKNRGRKAKALF